MKSGISETDCRVLEQSPAAEEVQIIKKDVENTVSSTSSEEAAAAATCRICMDSQGDNKDDALISPCMCKGTLQFVHRSCLDCWRSEGRHGDAFSHCTTCKAEFHLRSVVQFEENSCRKTKFRLYATWFLAILTVIGLFAVLAYLADKVGALKGVTNNDKWNRILSRHPILGYYCISFINCLPGLLTICITYTWSQRKRTTSWQRHYPMLTKRELTQVYVVEDLHGHYTPVKHRWIA